MAGNSELAGTDRTLPNFFILGAAKAGTTSLYEILNSHPNIYLSKIKEPQFFCHEDLYSKGMDYYREKFFPGCENYAVRGEATPHYLYYEKVAQRIATNIPRDDVKFIVIFRDPVKRAYSLYWNMVSEGVETLSFEEALNAEPSRSRTSNAAYSCGLDYQYKGSGMYAHQIRNYLEYFDRDQFLFLFFEDLQKTPEKVFSETCDFLGVSDTGFLHKEKVHNTSGLPRSRVLHDFLRRPSRVKKSLGKLIPERMKYALVTKVLNLNKKAHRYPALDETTEARLRRQFQDDILDLETLTGRRLTHWLPDT